MASMKHIQDSYWQKVKNKEIRGFALTTYPFAFTTYILYPYLSKLKKSTLISMSCLLHLLQVKRGIV